MHVTRVELDNIKSYARAEFAFEPGTTAIVGRNGAGKTTILEAIAWALFDVLDYSKEDFLRRGAKKGSVRVTFESDVDGRQYTVYRDTGTGYYVHDPGLGARIAEKKQDVSAFLRQHLGVEPGTDLAALFKSAVGVPQGTLTADFLKPASQRKAAFDRLLKVEEYRESAQRLNETSRLIGERLTEVKVRMGRAEGALARYDEIVEEHRQVAARAEELDAALAQLQGEGERRARAVRAFDEAERRVAETRAQAGRAEVGREPAARRLLDLRGELEAALRARERLLATEADYGAHLAALDALQQLEAERAERERLRAEADRAERMIVSAEGDVRRLSDALAAAEEARAALGALEAEIERQEERERERERLRDLRARAVAASERLARLDADLDALRRQHAQAREQVRQAEGARGAAVRVEELQSERLGVESELSKAEQSATARRHLEAQRREHARELKRLQEAVARLERETAALEARARGAELASELEESERELREQAARLRAEIERNEKLRAQTKGGVCPVLGDQCSSFGEGHSFESFFAEQIKAGRARLAAVQTEAARAQKQARAAREAGVALVQLERERAQLAQERALLTEREQALARVERELRGLAAVGDGRLEELRARLFGIDAELIPAREAQLRYAELEPLRQRLKEIEGEGKRKKEDRAELAAAASAVGALDKDIAENEAQLRALNDPRGRATGLRREAARADAIAEELRGVRDALSSLAVQRDELNVRLARFADFEARWSGTVRRRDETAAAYREYLASEGLAAKAPEREAEVVRAAEESERAAREAARAAEAHAQAVGSYDRERHASEREQLTLVRERAAGVAAQLEAAREREWRLGAELARLDEVREQLREEDRQLRRLKRLGEVTDFVRETLKQAGPLVTESYLYNISIEANQLFREITGEAGQALRWTKDYDIVVEEGGYERSFVNLSGGEQMAAALAVRLALLKQLSDIRLAFFDEPTVNMDAERRERLAQQIGQVRNFDQLFVISHDDTFEEAVDHVRRVPEDGLAEGARAA